MDLFDRIMELSRYGYFCSQILAILMLDTIGEENPGLVKAMGGLNGGVGYSQGCCGCMTGGVCLISYFTGKGEDTGYDDPQHKPALSEFTKWFEEEMTAEYGGIDCRDITKGNPAKRVEYCPAIIAATFEKCMEILQERELL
ncbi:MAG: C_GCAxxG_C_C family protein [Oscillospiraceae bacterium]|nr:C_GCAxxG_C_C family protein [Oscillospiraceae bacterium]